MSTQERALAIAAEAHAGQTDKGGEPYILPPIRVMLATSGLHARIAALLHDVVEDSEWTLDALRAEGFPQAFVEAVDAVTRRAGEDYLAFCRRAAAHPVGRAVKLADLRDNLDLDRIAEPTDRDRDRPAQSTNQSSPPRAMSRGTSWPPSNSR